MWFTLPHASLKRTVRRHEETPYGRWPAPSCVRPKRSFLPRLETLEDRTLLSTFTVMNLNDSGPGSLRQAIMDANANPGADSIDFTPGLHGSIALSGGELDITDTVTINGPGASELAVSGNHASRVFAVLGASATITGLTITQGLANAISPIIPSFGGGILNLGALTVRNDILSDNQALGDARVSPFGATGLAHGGGIENGGLLIVARCTFTGNQAQGGSGSSGNFYPGNAGGGGLCNDPGGIASVTDSQFMFNFAKGGDRSRSAASGAGIAGGGAIENLGATMTVTGSTFSYNQGIGGNDSVSAYLTGLGFGGAIKSGTQTTAVPTNSGYISTANPTLVVSHSTFDHNQALGGSGNQITAPEPSPLGANSAFCGGVLVFGGTGTISDSTFHDNQALGGAASTGSAAGLGVGGGIVAISFTPAVSVTVSNSTIDDNSAVGGQGGLGRSGGDGWGGGLASLLRATLSVDGSTVAYNQAQGGDGASGGSGLGGGLLNDSFSTLAVTASTITYNQALGGHGQNGGEREGGVGVGGGVYNLGTASFDDLTIINKNQASTNHDDLFDSKRRPSTNQGPDDPPAPGGVDVISTDPNDWPMYTHDPSGSRYNSAETRLRPDNVGGLHVEWTLPTQSAIAGTPTVVNDVVYAADFSGTVYAVSRDGKELWEHRVTVHSPPALPATVALAVTTSLLVTNHTIVFGDLGGDIHGLDIHTGAELWTVRPNDQPAAAIYSSATMVGHYVAIGIASVEELAMLVTPHYVPSFRGSVVLLDPADGHVIWETYTISAADRAAGATGAAVWSTPTFDAASNTLYVTTGNNYTLPTTATSDAVIALDAADGHIKWVHQLTAGDEWNHTFGPQSPEHPDYDFADSPHVYEVAGRTVVGAGQKSGFYHVLDAATGAEINAPLQVAPGGQLGGIFADSAVVNGVTYANGTNWPNVLGGSPPLGGSLTAIAGDGSRQVWQVQTPAPNESGVAAANGVVYFQSLDGNLYALDAATGMVLATVPTGGYGRESGPAISRGQVYLGIGDVLGDAFSPTEYTGPGAIVALGIDDRHGFPANPFGHDDTSSGQQGDPWRPHITGANTHRNWDLNVLAALSAVLAKEAQDSAGADARLVLPSGSTGGGHGDIPASPSTTTSATSTKVRDQTTSSQSSKKTKLIDLYFELLGSVPIGGDLLVTERLQ
jgi:polyvinyl alcohol dehydrogenase (cytochrome)